MTEIKWFNEYDNVVRLTSYMADNGYDAQEVAYAVEKPWKFVDVWEQAKVQDD